MDLSTNTEAVTKSTWSLKKVLIILLLIVVFILYSLALISSGYALDQGTLKLPFAPPTKNLSTSLANVASTVQIKGQILSVSGSNVIVQSDKGVKSELPLDQKLYIVKQGSGQRNMAVFYNVSDIELNKEATIIVKTVDNQMRVYSINYTQFPVDIR